MRRQHDQESRTCYPIAGAEPSTTVHYPPYHLARHVVGPAYLLPSNPHPLLQPTSTLQTFTQKIAYTYTHFHVSSLRLFSPLPSRIHFHMYNLELVALVCISLFFYLGVGILSLIIPTPPPPTPSRFTSSFFVCFLFFTSPVDLVYFGTS